MKRLPLLALLGLAMSDTDPRDLGRFCSPGGECPANWEKIGGDCIMFPGGDEARAREVCRQNSAEYRHSGTPHCLHRCSCGKPNRVNMTVSGTIAEKNEYPWQGKFSIKDCIFPFNI